MMFEKESEFTLNYKKLNARIDNLYWRKYNNWYLEFKKFDFSLFHQVESESPITVVNTVPVLQFDSKGNFIKEYPSLKIASIEAHVALGQIILCLKNRQKTAGGYQWKYKNDFDYGSKGTTGTTGITIQLARKIH
jgi:hypothetical protein